MRTLIALALLLGALDAHADWDAAREAQTMCAERMQSDAASQAQCVTDQVEGHAMLVKLMSMPGMWQNELAVDALRTCTAIFVPDMVAVFGCMQVQAEASKALAGN